jgi:excisionase family DNA binding protein
MTANSFLPAEMLDIHEVAEMLKISAATVRRYYRAGALRATRFGTQTIRFHPLDVDAFLFKGAQKMRKEAEARAARPAAELVAA